MKVSFEKYQGAGNDFVIIDNRRRTITPDEEIVKKLCDRHFGIGADGLILLENDTESDFFMRYFNADGREGTMCGNGGRCVALFAQKQGIIQNETVFNAMDGLHRAEILVSGESSAMVKLKMSDVENVIQKNGQFIIDSGSPHLVIPVTEIDKIDVAAEGRKIRYGELFAEEGINVDFVRVHDDGVDIRTYERGVENETLACGTGAVAAALITPSLQKGLEPPVDVKALGGNLRVYFIETDGKYTNIWLEGPASLVFKGEMLA